METAHREYDSWWYVLIMAVTSVYVIVCWFLCWILFLPCQLSGGTWKKPACGWTDDLARSLTKKISCRTQNCNFWKRPSTDFDKNCIFGIGTSSAIELHLSFLLSISWPSDEPCAPSRTRKSDQWKTEDPRNSRACRHLRLHRRFAATVQARGGHFD